MRRLLGNTLTLCRGEFRLGPQALAHAGRLFAWRLLIGLAGHLDRCMSRNCRSQKFGGQLIVVGSAENCYCASERNRPPVRATTTRDLNKNGRLPYGSRPKHELNSARVTHVVDERTLGAQPLP